MDSNFVDFDDDDDDNIKDDKHLSLYKMNNKEIVYDSITMETYRVLRKNKLDVFTREPINEEYAFKFEYQWDPYTGERLGKDPYGALHFHPDSLIRYFDLKKLDGLWIAPKDEKTGYFAGYYDYFLGSGENITIRGRGTYPELYLFRLPISDCYLTKEHSMSIVTMGPRLTNKELELIDSLANKYFKDNYQKLFGKKRPNLKYMKKLYDQALKTGDDNRSAVDLLKKL